MILQNGEVYISGPGHYISTKNVFLWSINTVIKWFEWFCETCYEVDIMQLHFVSIHKYNTSMLSRLSGFVQQFLECDLIFVTCKRNYFFVLKKLFLVITLSGDGLAVERWLRSIAMLDYRVINQTCLSLTGIITNAKLGNQAVPNEALWLAAWGWRCLYSELQTDKSDLSLYNQAVQNSVINILPRVGPLTVFKSNLKFEYVVV